MHANCPASAYRRRYLRRRRVPPPPSHLRTPLRLQLAPDSKASATATASSRACTTRYPTHVRDGVLFVWLDASPEGLLLSAASEPYVPEELQGSPFDWLSDGTGRDGTGGGDVRCLAAAVTRTACQRQNELGWQYGLGCTLPVLPAALPTYALLRT